MRIPISTRKSYRRKGGNSNGGNGKTGGGDGGGKLNSGKGISRGGDELRDSNVDGLPEDHKKATAYEGGGIPTEVKSWHPKESSIGSGTGDQVYGTGHRPSAPISGVNTLGFKSVAPYLEVHTFVGCYLDLGCYSLPQDKTRPGGEVVELTITANANDSVPFFFISDNDSAIEIQGAIQGSCSDVAVSDPIPFNSTNNLQLDTVVQYYRGDSTRESSGSPNFTPFLSSVNTSTRECLNYTIGESIPLMSSGLTQVIAGLGGPPIFSLPM